MNKKIIFIIPVVLILIIVFGLVVAVNIFGKDYAPKNLVISNIRSSEAVISFFSDKSSKSCILSFGWLALANLTCQPQNTIHYIQLEGLSSGKTYHFLIWQNGLPFGQFLAKKTISPKLPDNVPAPEQIGKPQETWVSQTMPSFKLSSQNEDKLPFIVRGTVTSSQPEQTFIYFINSLNNDTLSTTVNLGGKFIIDIKELMPADNLQIISREAVDESIITINAAELMKGDLQLGI